MSDSELEDAPSESVEEKLLTHLNDGVPLDELIKSSNDLISLNNYANSHPELSLAGSIRADLNQRAAALPVNESVEASDS